MDECTGKRAAAGFGLSRRGSNLAFRDPNHEDRSIQYCNRIGCSTRLNPMKGTQIVNPDKAKYSRVSFRSMSSKATAGSMSRPFSVSSDFRKPHRERQNRTSLQVAAVAESSSRQGEIEDLGHRTRHEETEVSESSSGQGGTEDMESSPTTTGMQTVLPNPGDLESAILQGFSADASEELGSCTTSSNSRTRKQINQRLGSENQDTSSSVRRSFASRNTSQAGKPVSLGLGAGVQRYGLKNLSCTSISDVLPSGCSSSDSGHNRRVDAVRKRSSDGESSSARGKGISAPSSRRNSDSSHTALSGPNSSPSERLIPQQASRRARTRPTTRDGVASVRTRRPTSGDTSMRLLEQEDDNSLSLPERIMIPQLPQTQFSIAEVVPESSSRSLPLELPPLCHNTLGRPGSSSRTAQRRPISRPEDISTQMFHGPLGDRDGYRRLNMEGIAEVLLALERIEQDEELTYEQLLVLETNLFLGGLNFHDQHRDMRLDIDNMSYEELLDLEEKMGNVSTALSEEALSRCLKRSIYVPASFFSGIAGHGDDDIKCSICQEEYAVGDEMGKLGCEHRYHVACIDQWLRQKNRCPICKAAASPSQHPHN